MAIILLTLLCLAVVTAQPMGGIGHVVLVIAIVLVLMTTIAVRDVAGGKHGKRRSLELGSDDDRHGVPRRMTFNVGGRARHLAWRREQQRLNAPTGVGRDGQRRRRAPQPRLRRPREPLA